MSLLDQVASELANVPDRLMVSPRIAASASTTGAAVGAGNVGVAARVTLGSIIGPQDGLWWEQISGRISGSIAQTGTIASIALLLADSGLNPLLELGQASVTTLNVVGTAGVNQNSFVAYPPTKLALYQELQQLMPGFVQPLQIQCQLVVAAAAAANITLVLDVVWRYVRGTGE